MSKPTSESLCFLCFQQEDRMSNNDHMKVYMDNTTDGASSPSPEHSPPLGVLKYEFCVEPKTRKLFMSLFNMAKSKGPGVRISSLKCGLQKLEPLTVDAVRSWALLENYPCHGILNFKFPVEPKTHELFVLLFDIAKNKQQFLRNVRNDASCSRVTLSLSQISV